MSQAMSAEERRSPSSTAVNNAGTYSPAPPSPGPEPNNASGSHLRNTRNIEEKNSSPLRSALNISAPEQANISGLGCDYAYESRAVTKPQQARAPYQEQVHIDASQINSIDLGPDNTMTAPHQTPMGSPTYVLDESETHRSNFNRLASGYVNSK